MFFFAAAFHLKKWSEVFIRNNILYNYDFESAFLHQDLFILIVKVDFFKSSAIRQKDESQNGGNKKTKINLRFSENFLCFVFLLPPFWDLPFCLITDEIVFDILAICYDILSVTVWLSHIEIHFFALLLTK